MSNWIVSMKVILISAGIVFAAMGLKFAVPVSVEGILATWSAVVAWMKPPYLYIIANCIILTIAVTSRFHKTQSPSPSPPVVVRSEQLISVKTPPQSCFEGFSAQQEIENAVAEYKPLMVSDSKEEVETEKEIVVETECESSFDDSTKDIFPAEIQSEPLLPARAKPLVSSRFAHRKPIRNTPEGSNTRALRVARPKRQETLESTWKMTTEGCHVPLTRHQKKSEAWDLPAPNESESTARIIRKEPSPGQEELNRRVEAFIKKFNEEMRIQRQESLKQFMEMINRGV